VPDDGDRLVGNSLIGGLAFSPDGGRLATIGGGQLSVWETATGRALWKLRAPVDAVAFSPDGKRIATSTHYRWKLELVQGRKRERKVAGDVTFWDADSGKELMRLDGGAKGIAFDPDGKRLAAGHSDGSVTVWDAENGQVLVQMGGHSNVINSLSFSRDGRRIATASDDHTVRIWDARVGQELLTLRGHDAPVVSVAFSPDGTRLASAHAKQPSQVKLWEAGPPRSSKRPAPVDHKPTSE
jgi:WD40 repeat protein